MAGLRLSTISETPIDEAGLRPGRLGKEFPRPYLSSVSKEGKSSKHLILNQYFQNLIWFLITIYSPHGTGTA
jgi:hypothetical protein